MIQLLFTVMFVEMGLILAFVFRTPFRKLVIMGIDGVKRGRGPVVMKTVAGTVVVLLLSSLYGMMKIQKRWVDDSGLVSNPTDQVLFSSHMLESTLMGAMLFLALMIDRLHHYMKELRLRRKTMEGVKKQNRNVEADDEVKSLKEEMMTVREKLKLLESQLENRGKDLTAAEANAVALRKQSQGFLLEYDRLVEENQNLRSQLQTLDRKLSWSGSKKNT